jgi:hypothetical protein
MTDLFSPKLTQKEQVLNFIQKKHWAKTHEVIEFGLGAYMTGADRLARKLTEEGKIRRLTDDEKIFRFGNTREDIWEAV